MAKRSSSAARRQWTEADARSVLADWERSGDTLEAFARSRAAIAYSIIGSCRLAGVDPREYLADVLPRLTGRIRLVDLPSLLPSRWAAQRASSSTTTGAAVAQP